MPIYLLQYEMEDCSRICDLVTTSVLHFIEPKSCSLTKETEKDTLISLSRVCRKIRQWSSEDNCQSEHDALTSCPSGHYCSQNLDLSVKGEHDCLANVVSTMVAFLNVDSQFVQHVAGSILLSLSSIIAKDGNKWVEYIHLLLIILEAAVSSILSSISLVSQSDASILIDEHLLHGYPLTTNMSLLTEDLSFDCTEFVALLQVRLGNVNLIIIPALLRILRSILKSLKLEDSDLEGILTDLVVSTLTKIHWDLFCGIHFSESSDIQVKSCKVDLLDGKGLDKVKVVLLGSLVQLLCSLGEQNDPEDENVNPLGECAAGSRFIKLVPKLLSCCFSKCFGHKDKCLFQYLAHKMLILVNRLSLHTQWRLFHPVMCLKLLKLYCKDIIFQSISKCDAVFEECLEASPFYASINDGATCNRHLQRLAIFLYFRCCFSLISSKETGQGCPCVMKAVSFSFELQPCSEKCYRLGLLELSEWIDSCGFLQKSTDNEDRSESCCSFALSFMQLYIEEDDMFFEMLLLLLDAPFFSSEEWSNERNRSSRMTEKGVLHDMKSIFDPVDLFHLFLLLIHYDHLVLIDCLISKDAGVQCARYLLRCLRIICNSWHAFVEISDSVSEKNERRLKRQKIYVEHIHSRKLGSLPSLAEDEGQSLSRKTIGNTERNINPQSFENAKYCLLSLEKSVGDLHEKSLFPYNPKPLLRSLRRFEELCTK